MKHAVVLTLILALAVLTSPAVLAQEAAAPEASPLEATPKDASTCLLGQQPVQQTGTCEDECREEYEDCLIFCSKNPCFVACETVLDICLDNCH